MMLDFLTPSLSAMLLKQFRYSLTVSVASSMLGTTFTALKCPYSLHMLETSRHGQAYWTGSYETLSSCVDCDGFSTQSGSALGSSSKVSVCKRTPIYPLTHKPQLHTVSSLDQANKAIKQGDVVKQQTDAAISQGKDIGILTKMTVYIAFPVLVTTAIFSMDIVTPEQPWAVLVGVLAIAFCLNLLIAWLIAQPFAQPSEIWKRLAQWAD